LEEAEGAGADLEALVGDVLAFLAAEGCSSEVEVESELDLEEAFLTGDLSEVLDADSFGSVSFCLRRRVAGLATLDLVFVLLLSDLSILCFLLDVAVGLLAGRVSLSLDGGGRRSAWSIYLRGRNDLVVLEAIDNLTIEVR
jgi:hypothetical protein